MIKAVFFDIDGTLIDHDTKMIPDSTKEALALLQNKGIKVFVATGRSPINLDVVRSNFAFDGYLCCNGQYCFNNEEIIYEKYINNEDLKTLLPYINENNIPVLFAEMTKSYSNIHNYCLDESAKHLNDERYPIKNAKDIINQKIVQMMAYIDEKDDQEFLKYAPHCKSVRWTPRFADIIPIDGGKNVGIDRIIDYYGISLDETMAFGDGNNDIAMLNHVKIGVAMGNADISVKEASDFVTKSVNEDGIYFALENFSLI